MNKEVIELKGLESGDLKISNLQLKDLQPSQFYISAQKLAEVRAWLDPQNLSGFAPIPVKLLDGIPVMTDGHTRAVAALMAGLGRVPLVWDEDDLDWEMYRRCVAACQERGVISPSDLLTRILPEAAYQEEWDRWCDEMQADVWCERAISYIQELFRGDAGGHGADHSLRVYRNALLIAEQEKDCNRTVVRLAALLHDADDHKLFHTENHEHARAFLTANQVPEAWIEAICAAIRAVSFSQNGDRQPATLEGRIVQDADRLDAIGAIGIARTFAYGGAHDRPLTESVQHFYEKLLLLKERMNTETARRLAEQRHAFLETYLRELQEETGEVPRDKAGGNQ